MDVTQEFNKKYDFYGGSRSTNQAYVSANKSLQYAKQGANISDATPEKVTVVPSIINYKDTVGLFGVENVYIKLNLDIQSFAYEQPEIIINTYYDAKISDTDAEFVNTYYQAVIDPLDDRFTVNTYEPANITNTLPGFARPMISVDLTNLKTGNQYIDAWLDIRIYTKDKVEHPYDRLIIPIDSYCYLGFHARNTRRLPYNIRCKVGEIYSDLIDVPASERKYIFTG